MQDAGLVDIHLEQIVIDEGELLVVHLGLGGEVLLLGPAVPRGGERGRGGDAPALGRGVGGQRLVLRRNCGQYLVELQTNPPKISPSILVESA